MNQLPSFDEIEVFKNKFLEPYLAKFKLLFAYVQVEDSLEYATHLDLDLSEEGLIKLQEKAKLIYKLDLTVAKELKLSDSDIKQVGGYSKSIKKQSKKEIDAVCSWWEKVYSSISDGHILFAKCESTPKHINEYKIEFQKSTSQDMDFVHGLINLHIQLRNLKTIKTENEQTSIFEIRDLETKINGLREKLKNQASKAKEFMQILSQEIENSTLPISIKNILAPHNEAHSRYWDDPRTLLPFSIQSNIKQIRHGTYHNGVMDIITGAESQILPFGDAIVAWDNKNHSTADSCRISFSRNHVSIAISDGATQGGFNSALFAHVLTAFVSSYMPVSQNGMYYFNRKPLIELYQSMLHSNDSLNGGMHSKIREFGHVKAQENSSSQNKIKAIATIAQVTVQRSGTFQASRFGDCCIFKLTVDNEIIHINVDPKLEESETDLIGPATRWGSHVVGKVGKELVIDGVRVPDTIVEGVLDDKDILFGCTDHVALYVVKYPEKAANLIRKISDNSSKSDMCGELFEQVATNLKGEDDLTFFTYKHIAQNIPEKEVVCSVNDEDKLVIDGVEYEVIEADRYYCNKELGKGVKRIEKMVYDNLNHFQDTFNNQLDFLVDSHTGVSRTDPNNLTYFVFMPHLSGPNYINMGIELDELSEQYGHDQTAYIENLSSKLDRLYVQMERSGATHLDLGPSNIFVDKRSGELVCIDPNAFYCKGSFVGNEIGHCGMYGTETTPSHATCLLAHRFPLKLMKFSLDLIKSGIKTEDTNSVWTHFNNTDDAIFLSKEEIDVIAFPNWPDNKDKLVELKLQLSEKFNLQPKKINDWINQFDCERSIYTFDLN